LKSVDHLAASAVAASLALISIVILRDRDFSAFGAEAAASEVELPVEGRCFFRADFARANCGAGALAFAGAAGWAFATIASACGALALAALDFGDTAAFGAGDFGGGDLAADDFATDSILVEVCFVFVGFDVFATGRFALEDAFGFGAAVLAAFAFADFAGRAEVTDLDRAGFIAVARARAGTLLFCAMFSPWQKARP
jgi:hypothetical protein